MYNMYSRFHRKGVVSGSSKKGVQRLRRSYLKVETQFSHPHNAKNIFERINVLGLLKGINLIL